MGKPAVNCAGHFSRGLIYKNYKKNLAWQARFFRILQG